MNVGRKRTYAGRERSKTPFKRTKAKRTKTQSRKLTRVDRPLGLSQRVVHRYVEEQLSLNPGVAGLPAEYFFSANGLYDPNISGVGHQPIGFDQIGTFFDHYTVIYSQINVWFNNIDSGISQFVGIKMDDNTSSAGTISKFVENGSCVWTSCGCTCSGDDNKMLSMEMDVSRFLGRPKIMSEDDLRGDTSNNPTEQAYWHIMAAPNVAQDSNLVRILVEITYVAIWTEPKDLDLS